MIHLVLLKRISISLFSLTLCLCIRHSRHISRSSKAGLIHDKEFTNQPGQRFWGPPQSLCLSNLLSLFLASPGIYARSLSSSKQVRLNLIPQATLRRIWSLNVLLNSFPPQGEAWIWCFSPIYSALTWRESWGNSSMIDQTAVSVATGHQVARICWFLSACQSWLDKRQYFGCPLEKLLW